MNASRTTRSAAVTGMAAAVLWAVALIAEYQYGLRPPGDGSAAYQADQAAFFAAQVGYLLVLIAMFSSKAGGPGLFGRVAIAIWVVAGAAIGLAQLLGLVGITATFLLPISGLGAILGSILTSVAVWRARRWTSWRRLAPAIWTAYFLVMLVSVIASIPVLTIPAEAPSPSAPAPVLEGLWQGAWFLLSFALYIEAGRTQGREKGPTL
jgi:hypothetical protein